MPAQQVSKSAIIGSSTCIVLWNEREELAANLHMNRLEFKTSRKNSLITFEESMEYTSNLAKKTERSQHVTGWTCFVSLEDGFYPPLK
jgi:hypothetical protein